MFLYIFGVPFFRVLLSRRWAQLERGSLRMLADEAAAVAASSLVLWRLETESHGGLEMATLPGLHCGSFPESSSSH